MKLIALIELNQLCKLQCEYCFYHDYGREKSYITETIFNELILPETTDIYLTGGEPFINKNIVKILKSIKSKGMTCTVFCDGVTISKYKDELFTDCLNNIDRLIISFDDFREEYTIRTIQPNLILDGIKRVLNYDKNILEVKIGVNNFNVMVFKETIEGLITLGVQKLSINLIHDINNSNKKFEILDKDKINEIFNIIDYFLPYFDSAFVGHLKDYKDGKTNKLIKTCRAGESFYFINCEGKFFGCPAFLKDIPVHKSLCISKECINLWEMY